MAACNLASLSSCASEVLLNSNCAVKQIKRIAAAGFQLFLHRFLLLLFGGEQFLFGLHLFHGCMRKPATALVDLPDDLRL